MTQYTTLAFMTLKDYADELARRGTPLTRLQTMVVSETEGDMICHTWIVVLTLVDPEGPGEVLACRVAVFERLSAWFRPDDTLHDAYDPALVQAADAISTYLAERGIATKPGVYAHEPVGWAHAGDLWHYDPGGGLVLGPEPEGPETEPKGE